jgi:hypothetical protein
LKKTQQKKIKKKKKQKENKKKRKKLILLLLDLGLESARSDCGESDSHQGDQEGEGALEAQQHLQGLFLWVGWGF